MFKKDDLNTSTLNSLKNSTLTFDINSDPPTLEDINERIKLLPDEEILDKKVGKHENLNLTICLSLSIILMASIFWPLTKDIFLSIVFSLICSLLSPLILFKYIISKDRDLLKYIQDEKTMLIELHEEDLEEMLNFCKSSPVCMNYKNKVIAQNRPLLLAEYYLFKNQIEKERKESIKKELYGTEQEKEDYASYSL